MLANAEFDKRLHHSADNRAHEKHDCSVGVDFHVYLLDVYLQLKLERFRPIAFAEPINLRHRHHRHHRFRLQTLLCGVRIQVRDPKLPEKRVGIP